MVLLVGDVQQSVGSDDYTARAAEDGRRRRHTGVVIQALARQPRKRAHVDIRHDFKGVGACHLVALFDLHGVRAGRAQQIASDDDGQRPFRHALDLGFLPVNQRRRAIAEVITNYVNRRAVLAGAKAQRCDGEDERIIGGADRQGDVFRLYAALLYAQRQQAGLRQLLVTPRTLSVCRRPGRRS